MPGGSLGSARVSHRIARVSHRLTLALRSSHGSDKCGVRAEPTGSEVTIVWDTIKYAIDDTRRTVRLVVILVVLTGTAWLLWHGGSAVYKAVTETTIG
jgi:hypothetical protein